MNLTEVAPPSAKHERMIKHIKKGVKEKDLDWSYWSLDNLQTLCRKCHKEKTKTDTANARKSKKEE